MQLYRLFIGLSLLFAALFASAQAIQLDRKNADVIQNGEVLINGFAGGMNSPQFSAVDFNNDGIQDVYAFDRVGNVSVAFRRAPSGTLFFDESLLANFPEMTDWVMLRDFNDDGIPDIFCYNDFVVSGIQVYQGYYDDDNLIAFERLSFANELDIIYTAVPGSGDTQLYVSEVDYPSIDDVDCDGDLDVLTFNIAGGYVEFYQNLSVENGYGRDSLQFVLNETCWGGFYESGISTELDLADQSGDCANGLVGEDVVQDRHAGSTLLIFDEDDDGDKDIVLGDLSFSEINLATNGGSCEEAWMDVQDVEFPSYDQPAIVPIFPATYYIDMDNDGKRDLVVAPNEDKNASDFNCVWFYQNTGSDNNPEFSFRNDRYLVEGMFDMGTGTSPAIFDYNADGLMDLVVGNFSFFEFFGQKNTRLYLLENVGTLENPAFELVDEDYLSMNQFSSSTFNFAPTFGDLDGDGDWDALVGEQNGQLFYFENTAGEGNPAEFAEHVYGYMDINIGQASVPQIIDLNRDGLVDIVVGERGGNINYFQNVGIASNPEFGADETVAPNVKNLGGVDTRIPGFTTGYAAPCFVDLNGEYRLFVGTQFGQIEVYGDIDGNLEGGDFSFLAENIEGFQQGSFIQPLLADWDNDQLLDLMVGNYRGGLGFYSTNLALDGTVDTEEPADLERSVRVFPNPANEQISVLLERGLTGMIRCLDAQGRLMAERQALSPTTVVDVTNWPAGLYLIQISNGGGLLTKKVVVQ